MGDKRFCGECEKPSIKAKHYSFCSRAPKPQPKGTRITNHAKKFRLFGYKTPERFICPDCKRPMRADPKPGEAFDFMVTDELYDQVVYERPQVNICLDCFEKRLLRDHGRLMVMQHLGEHRNAAINYEARARIMRRNAKDNVW